MRLPGVKVLPSHDWIVASGLKRPVATPDELTTRSSKWKNQGLCRPSLMEYQVTLYVHALVPAALGVSSVVQ